MGVMVAKMVCDIAHILDENLINLRGSNRTATTFSRRELSCTYMSISQATQGFLRFDDEYDECHFILENWLPHLHSDREPWLRHGSYSFTFLNPSNKVMG